jgi:hypothetical protein
VIFRELLNLLRPSPDIPTDERRETMRLRCSLGALLKVDDAMHFATLVNVTITGLCMELESPLRPGQTVSLTRDDFGQPLLGQVLWCKPRRQNKGYRIGVAYETDQEALQASWLKPALRQAGFKAEFPGEKRRLVRVPGRIACQIKGLTGEAYTDGEMLDLSLGGALVESPIEFPIDLTLAFETVPLGGLPALAGIAKVASCNRDPSDGKWRCGLRFTESKPQDIRKCMKSMLTSK